MTKVEEANFSICDFEVLYPAVFFQWQKLVYAETFPFFAYLALLNKKDLGQNLAESFKEGAETITICPISRCIHICGGVLGDIEVLINPEQLPDEPKQETVEEWESLPTRDHQTDKTKIQTWKNKSVFMKGGYSFRKLMTSQGSHGSLHIKGRVADALADPKMLDADVFMSGVRIDRDSNSIWVGDTRVWNVEVRVNPDLCPDAWQSELGDDLTQEIASTGTKLSMPSSGTVVREFEDWIHSQILSNGAPPKMKACEDWGKNRNFTRDSVRAVHASLPENLRRVRGQRD